METTISTASTASLSLEEQIARLQALLEASRQVHSTIKLEEVLLQTARILVRELEMEGAAFLTPLAANNPDQQVMASYGMLPEPPYLNCNRFPVHSKEDTVIAELVVASGKPCLSLYEQDFVEGIVLQTSVALENATFHERDLEWARLQQDLDAARAIQRSLLPKAMPEIENFSIAARSTTCYEVGGDYLDVVKLPDGTQLLVVADVAGKGLASAIVATSFRASMRSLTSQPIPLEDIVALVGQQHWEEGVETRRRYVTAIFARMHLDRQELEIVNAGHNPGALVLPDGTLRMIEASGTPLGMLPGMKYSTEFLPFTPGSKLLLYTDGLTEVFSGENEDDEFGSERLAEEFRNLSSNNATEVLESLWQTLEAFSSGAPQTDDMTALAALYLPPSQQELA